MSIKSSIKDPSIELDVINIGNYYNRIEYHKKAFKYLKQINKHQCLIPEHKNDDIVEYKVANNRLTLIKKIGSKSKYGLVYLTVDNDDNTLFSFATKLMPYNDRNRIEIIIVQFLSEITLKDKNPHFVLTYNAMLCDNKNDEIKPFLPNLIRTDNYIIAVNELANGNLKDFIFSTANTPELFLNALQQVILSILSFHYFTQGIFHNDCHYKNFLFHRIEPGGYFHYKIYDIDIYVENKGYVWMIWDFGLVGISEEKQKKRLIDYMRIILILNSEIKDPVFDNIKQMFHKITNYRHSLLYFFGNSDSQFFKELLFKIDGLFQTTIPEGSKIINKNPYIIN